MFERRENIFRVINHQRRTVNLREDVLMLERLKKGCDAVESCRGAAYCWSPGCGDACGEGARTDCFSAEGLDRLPGLIC